MNHEPLHPDEGPTPEQLVAYADGELGPDAQARVEAWLLAHPEARAEVDAHRRLLRLWEATSPEAPSPDRWSAALSRIEAGLARQGPDERRHPRGRWPFRLIAGLVAAAAAVVGVLVARPWLTGRPANDPPPVVKKAERPASDVVLDPEDAGSEPWAVVSASEVDVEITIRHDDDANAVVMVGGPLMPTFGVAAPEDSIEVHEARPSEWDGPTAQLKQKPMPMLVMSSGNEEP
jgi:anti-sigma factor RsiW